MSEPRAYTKEEVRTMLLKHAHDLVRYWANDARTPGIEDKLSGFAHSFLTAIDGLSGGFPCSLDLVCRPHPDDEEYQRNQGENWVPDGLVINDDTILNDVFYRPENGWAGQQ